MSKNFYYILINFIFFLFLFFNTHVYAAKVSPDTLTNINDQTSYFITGAGLSAANTSVGSIIATVISAFLALLGIIFVVLILIAGYNWMTALGDEEKVTKAKNTLQRAIIGLIIIVAAYAITYFVFNKLPWGETSTSSSNNTGTGGSSVGGEVNNTTDNNDNDDSIINEISPINK